MKKNEFYNELWKKEWKTLPKTGPSVRTRYRTILNLFKKYNLHGRIIDVGCGDGTLLSLLPKNSDNELYGFDISNEVIEHAKKRGSISKLFVGDLTKSETLPKEKFDVVICSDVLEHIRDHRCAVRNISKIVKKRGELVISVPHSMKYWTKHDDFSGHYTRFERPEFEKELEMNGFRIIESFTWGFPIYAIYYFFLKKVNPPKVMSESKSSFKRLISNILYQLFRIDDLFRTNRGRKLFILAMKFE